MSHDFLVCRILFTQIPDQYLLFQKYLQLVMHFFIIIIADLLSISKGEVIQLSLARFNAVEKFWVDIFVIWIRQFFRQIQLVQPLLLKLDQ